MPASLLLLLLAAAAWAQLFDGRTSAGWTSVTGRAFPAGSWVVEDGCLKSRVVDGGFEDIRTVDAYRDFELEFEWKLEPGGNSGVKYRLEKVDEWKAPKGPGNNARGRGPEFQLMDDAAVTDPKQMSGALYSVQPPSTPAAHAVGEWNSARLLARGGHVEHWINGVKVMERDGMPERETPIVLQNHHSVVYFKNLRIRKPEGETSPQKITP